MTCLGLFRFPTSGPDWYVALARRPGLRLECIVLYVTLALLAWTPPGVFIRYGALALLAWTPPGVFVRSWKYRVTAVYVQS